MTTRKPVVLMVDDEEEIRTMAKVAFEEIHGHQFISASTFDGAVRSIHDTHGDMVAFVDIHLRGKKSGLDLLNYIQENAAHRVIPYAFTGETSLFVETKALQAGAINVFHKGVDSIDRLVAYTEKSLVRRMLRRGVEDDLTNLFNFYGFKRATVAEMKVARDREGSRHPSVFSLLFIDLDKFKSVNDTYGHLTGDLALKHVAGIIATHVRPTDHICRKGGDEFLVWLPNLNEKKAVEVGAHLKELVSSCPIKTEREEAVLLSISVGTSQIKREEIGATPEHDLISLIAKANKKEMVVKASRVFSSR